MLFHTSHDLCTTKNPQTYKSLEILGDNVVLTFRYLLGQTEQKLINAVTVINDIRRVEVWLACTYTSCCCRASNGDFVSKGTEDTLWRTAVMTPESKRASIHDIELGFIRCPRSESAHYLGLIHLDSSMPMTFCAVWIRASCFIVSTLKVWNTELVIDFIHEQKVCASLVRRYVQRHKQCSSRLTQQRHGTQLAAR